MGKDKLKRFAAIKEMAHVEEPTHEEMLKGCERLKGKWGEVHFKNDNPIVLELGCGGGEYTIALAQRFPDKNFIGVDIKGARIWKGATYAQEQEMRNVAFLRTRIDFIESFFAENEVSEIWITFPDPQLKYQREKKRLTGPAFLKKYNFIMKRGGRVHLKTDSVFLLEYTLKVLKEKSIGVSFSTRDVYACEDLPAELEEILKVKTFYENMWLEQGKKINYLQFFLDEAN